MYRLFVAATREIFGQLPGRSFVNSGIYTLAHGLPQAINFFLLPVYTRYLTPEEFGIFSFTSAILVFVPIFASLSLNTYFLRHYRTVEDDAERKTLIGTVSVTLIVLTICIVSLSLAFLPAAFLAFDISVSFDPYMKFALLYGAIEVVAIIPQNYFRITENAKAFFVLIAVRISLVAAITLYLLVAENYGLLSRYYGLLAASSLMLIYYIGLIWRVSQFKFSATLLRQGIKFSFPLAISALLVAFLGVIDRFVLERYSTLSELGIYAIALTVSGGIALLVNSIYKAFEPQFYAQENNRALNDYAVRVRQIILTVVVLAAVPLIAIIHEILTLLVSPNFYSAASVIIILVGAELIRGLTMPIVIQLLALDKTKYQPVITGFSGLTMIITSILLVPSLGAIGAAIANLTGALVNLSGLTVYSSRSSTISWRTTKAVGLSALVLGIAYGIQALEFESFALGSMIKLSLAAFIGLSFVFLVRTTRNQTVSNDLA